MDFRHADVVLVGVLPESGAASLSPPSGGVAGVFDVAGVAGVVLPRASPRAFPSSCTLSMVLGVSWSRAGVLTARALLSARSGTGWGDAVVGGPVGLERRPSVLPGTNLSCSTCTLIGPVPGRSTVKS